MVTALENPDILLAATGTASGKGKKVGVLAYTGGIMNVPCWGPVALDLRGIDIAGQIKLLSDHNSTRSGLIGHGIASVRGGKLFVDGVVTQATEAGREIIALSKDGLEFQASVGVEPSKYERIRPGTTVNVNGQVIESEKEFILVTAGRLREVSIVALGCDGNTTVKIAASRRTTLENPMETTIDMAEIRAMERERLGKIEAMCSGFTGSEVAELKKKAVSEEISIEDLQAGLLDAVKRDRELELERGRRPIIPVTFPSAHQPTLNGQAITAGLLNFFGHHDIAEKSFDARTMEQADRIRPRTFADISAACLDLEGRDTPKTTQGVISASFSTYTLPTALGDAANKITQSEYSEAPASYENFANVVNVLGLGGNKPAKIIRPSFMGELQEVPETGEVKHGSASEDMVDLVATTFAQNLSIDRRAMINDDGQVFASTAAALGRNARRKVSDEIWRVILANGGNFFSADNGNYLTGADTALTIDGLAKAILIMISQRDKNGRDLDIRPRVLCVPPALQEMATAILSSTELARYVAAASDKRPTGNPFKNTLTLATEPRIANDVRFENTSNKQWFLFAGPQDAPVNLGFLNGQRTPIVESFGPSDQAERLAFTWRVVLDFGVGLGDHRAAVKSLGEAEE